MPPKKIERVSRLATMSLWEIKGYFKEMLSSVFSEGVVLYAQDIEALVKAIQREVGPPKKNT